MEDLSLGYMLGASLGMAAAALAAALAVNKADKYRISLSPPPGRASLGHDRLSGRLLHAFAFARAHIPLHDRWKLRHTLTLTKALYPVAIFNLVWEVCSLPDPDSPNRALPHPAPHARRPRHDVPLHAGQCLPPPIRHLPAVHQHLHLLPAHDRIPTPNPIRPSSAISSIPYPGLLGDVPVPAGEARKGDIPRHLPGPHGQSWAQVPFPSLPFPSRTSPPSRRRRQMSVGLSVKFTSRVGPEASGPENDQRFANLRAQWTARPAK